MFNNTFQQANNIHFCLYWKVLVCLCVMCVSLYVNVALAHNVQPVCGHGGRCSSCVINEVQAHPNVQAPGCAPVNLSKTGAIDYNTDTPKQGTDVNLVLDLNHSGQSVLNFQMCCIVLMS